MPCVEGHSAQPSAGIDMEGRGVWEHDLWCPSETDLVESGTYNADAFKEALNDISSTTLVPSGKDVSYRAGNEVHLLPGFHASSGSRFHAFVHPCDRAGNSFKSLQVSSTTPTQEGSTFLAKDQGSVTVQPNPNRGGFSVEIREPSSAIVEVRLVDAQGREVPIIWSTSIAGVQVKVVDHATLGVYLLQVLHMDGSLHSTKLLIEQ